MLVRPLGKKDAVEVRTDNGTQLHLISPGYFLNDDLYELYQKVGDGTEYEVLLNWMYSKYSGEPAKIKNHLDKALATLAKRELVSLEDREFDVSIGVVKSELDLKENYDFFPITQLDIVVTRACNFLCKHCYINFEQQSVPDFDYKMWTTICDKLARYGLQSVVITGGEPLTCGDLPKLILHLLQKGIHIILLTNGYLITEELIDSIAPYRSMITFQVSLDGSNPTSHDTQRNMPGAFEITTQNVRKLREKGIQVALSMVLSDFNSNDLIDGSIFELARELKVNMMGITPSIIKTGNATSNDIDLDEDKIIEIVQHVHNYPIDASYPAIYVSGPPAITKEVSISHTDLNRPRCRRGINSFAVRPDGSIVTCSDFAEIHYDEYEYGNILNDDLSTILQRAKEAQDNIMSRYSQIKGVCSICRSLSSCGGACRADAYSRYGDIVAPYPLCQRIYERGLFPPDMIDHYKEYKSFDAKAITS